MGQRDERPLRDQPWLRQPATRRVLDALEKDGRQARFVGGCVRDGLLGLADDAADLDIATPEPPQRVLELLRRAAIRAVPTGLAHGTITAVIGDRRFEVTTLRRDVSTDGRYAEVAFTDSFEEDAARRDFTINAMSADRSGRLYDYFSGRDDLARGRIRFVGEASRRISEDRLRILRFFRFYARFGRPPPDGAAIGACRAQAAGVRRLSGERIQVEMLKLMAAPEPADSLELMIETGVAQEVFFGPVAIARLRRLLALRPDADPLLRLAALLRPPPAEQGVAARTAERWRLSREEQRRLLAAMAPEVGLPATSAQCRRSIYRLGASRFRDLVSLQAAGRDDDPREALARALGEADRFEVPVLPISGDDVLAAGVAPGPEVGRILGAVEDWWLEHEFYPDRPACLARLRELVAPAPQGERAQP